MTILHLRNSNAFIYDVFHLKKKEKLRTKEKKIGESYQVPVVNFRQSISARLVYFFFFVFFFNACLCICICPCLQFVGEPIRASLMYARSCAPLCVCGVHLHWRTLPYVPTSFQSVYQISKNGDHANFFFFKT